MPSSTPAIPHLPAIEPADPAVLEVSSAHDSRRPAGGKIRRARCRMAIESSLQAKPDAAMSSRTVFLGRLIGLFLLLFVSPETVANFFDLLRFEQLFYFFAGITLVLGLYLTYAGFTASPPASA